MLEIRAEPGTLQRVRASRHPSLMPVKRKIRGRNQLARLAHFRTGAGQHGGAKKEQARRRRRRDRLAERSAASSGEIGN